MVYKITDLHSKPRKIKINSFMQWIKVGRICTQRALRTMKPLSDFDRDFQYFVQEESPLQAERILGAKDPDKAKYSHNL